MSVAEIKEMLDSLAAARAEADAAHQAFPGTARIDALTAELKELLDERTRFAEMYYEKAAAIERQVLDLTLALGETVRGDALMAVWSKPRVTWDGRALDGYLAAHPELAPFRHVGQPSVSIRSVRRDADA